MPDSVPLFRTKDLGGGFRLHLRRTRAFKTITARLAFQFNLDARSAARAVVPRVLGRGTERFPSLRELQTELDRLFGATLHGSVRKIGERQIIQFRASWITDRLAEAPLLREMGELLAEYLHRPADGLRESAILQERKMLADEAAAVFDDKGQYARHRLLEVMCKNEAYARPSIGRIDEIRALDVDSVRSAYREMLERAPVDLYLVGGLTWAQAMRLAKGLLLHRKRRSARLRRTVHRRPARVRTVRETQELGQAKLEMGFRTRVRFGSPLYPGLVLMNALFGGTAVGKLFKKVREEASLCYSIGSGIERTKGLVLVHAGIDAGDYSRTRRLIVRQLDELRAGRVAPEVEAQARGMLVSALNALRDSPSAMIDFGLEREVNGIDPDLDGLVAALRRVTVKDAARAARTVELDTVFLLRNR